MNALTLLDRFRESNRRRVLIVEDCQPDAELLSMKLKRMGIESETVTGLSEALDKLSTDKFDLVIIDMLLKNHDYNGLHVGLVIQSKYGDVPIVITSGESESESIHTAAKAFPFVPKPIPDSFLRSALRIGASVSAFGLVEAFNFTRALT